MIERLGDHLAEGRGARVGEATAGALSDALELEDGGTASNLFTSAGGVTGILGQMMFARPQLDVMLDLYAPPPPGRRISDALL